MRTRRPVLAVIASLLGLTLLTACVPSGPEPEPTATTTPSSTPDTTSTPTPTPTPTEEIIPFTADCNALITPAVMYAFDPNLSPFGAFTPDAGTVAADAVAAGGIACRWVHGTTGQTLDLAVAHLTASASTALKNDLVASSNSVPTYGVEGYFRTVGGVGEAQAFPDPYWVSIVSVEFAEPGDATPLMDAVIGALG
jgi:hypothetical protein